jgi:hypothetical protein
MGEEVGVRRQALNQALAGEHEQVGAAPGLLQQVRHRLRRVPLEPERSHGVGHQGLGCALVERLQPEVLAEVAQRLKLIKHHGAVQLPEASEDEVGPALLGQSTHGPHERVASLHILADEVIRLINEPHPRARALAGSHLKEGG